MDVIWYAVRCKAGMEQQTAEEWNQRHDGKACRAFIITYEKMKRYEGSWHLICEPLLSGYFFLKTEESKVLEEAQDSIPIDSGEERFLKELGGRDHHVPMSRGYIREGKTCVTEGPLCGHESQIQKIDRHKRLAHLDCRMDQYQRKGLWAGLEIVSQS